MGPAVNGAPPRPRAYDARRRQEAAEESRKRVLAQSRALFLAQGYGRTTVAAIARSAGVSKESVYKAFGGKPGLVRAIYEQSMLGVGGTPAAERSDRAQTTVTDPLELMEQFGRFVAEVSPLGSPVFLLIRDAAASGDPDMAALLRDVDDERYQRMLHNARQVLARGFLRPDLTDEEVADVMFMSTSAELYETLVLKRGWSAEQFGRLIARTLEANLLPESSADEGRGQEHR